MRQAIWLGSSILIAGVAITLGLLLSRPDPAGAPQDPDPAGLLTAAEADLNLAHEEVEREELDAATQLVERAQAILQKCEPLVGRMDKRQAFRFRTLKKERMYLLGLIHWWPELKARKSPDLLEAEEAFEKAKRRLGTARGFMYEQAVRDLSSLDFRLNDTDHKKDPQYDFLRQDVKAALEKLIGELGREEFERIESALMSKPDAVHPDKNLVESRDVEGVLYMLSSELGQAKLSLDSKQNEQARRHLESLKELLEIARDDPRFRSGAPAERLKKLDAERLEALKRLAEK